MSYYLILLVFSLLSFHSKCDSYNEEDITNQIKFLSKLDYKEPDVVTNCPIIGILVKNIKKGSGLPSDFKLYVEHKYVNFAMAGGGRVVPIDPNNISEIDDRIRRVNGILIPDGDDLLIQNNQLTNYSIAVKRILQYVITQNDVGLNTPLLAIGNGFDAINIVIAHNFTNLFTPCPNCFDFNTYLDFTLKASYSRIYSNENAFLLHSCHKHNLAYFYKISNIISSQNFNNDINLVHFFNILSNSNTSSSPQIMFPSSLESKKYPIYLTRFLPESPIFDYIPERNMNRSEEAIRFGLNIANYFVNEARKNYSPLMFLPDQVIYYWTLNVIDGYGPTYLK